MTRHLLEIDDLSPDELLQVLDRCTTPHPMRVLEDRGAALGLYTVFSDVAMSLAGPLGGLLVIAQDYRPVYVAATLLCAAAWVMTFRLARRAQAAADL